MEDVVKQGSMDMINASEIGDAMALIAVLHAARLREHGSN
jgi:hypothetical protein